MEIRALPIESIPATTAKTTIKVGQLSAATPPEIIAYPSQTDAAGAPVVVINTRQVAADPATAAATVAIFAFPPVSIPATADRIELVAGQITAGDVSGRPSMRIPGTPASVIITAYRPGVQPGTPPVYGSATTAQAVQGSAASGNVTSSAVTGTADTAQQVQGASAAGHVGAEAPVQRGSGGMPIPFVQRKRPDIIGAADTEQEAQAAAVAGTHRIGGAVRSVQSRGTVVAIGRRSMARQNEKTLLALIMRDAA